MCGPQQSPGIMNLFLRHYKQHIMVAFPYFQCVSVSESSALANAYCSPEVLQVQEFKSSRVLAHLP